MFLIIDLKATFHLQCVVTFIIWNYAKFHTPSSSISLTITIQPETKDNFCTAAILLFNISLKCYNNKLANFTNAYYHILSLDLKVSTASVAPPSEVCTSTTLLILAIRSEEVWHYVHTKFCENCSTVAKVKIGGPTGSIFIWNAYNFHTLSCLHPCRQPL